MILLYFSETERNSAELDMIDRRSQIINSVRSYNRRFSGKKIKTFGIFGLLDDLVIVALFLIYSSILYRNFVVQDDT